MRALIFMCILMLPCFAQASGPYDGIWRTSHNGEGYLTIHERNTVIIAAGHDVEDRTWEAFDGVREGNVINLSMIFGLGQASIRITFDSETRGRITVLSCTANLGSFCNFSVGDSLEIIKEF